MFEKLNAEVRDAAKQVRDLFNSYDVGHMELNIKVRGRTSGDELLLEYSICENYDKDVTGGDLGVVLDEYFRRRGWKTRNAPVAIPYVEKVAEPAEDEHGVYMTINNELAPPTAPIKIG